MSKKRILNVASKKKRDNMLSWTNVTAASTTGTTYAYGPAVLVGNQTSPEGAYTFAWNATARDISDVNGNAASSSAIATRTSTNCYMVGLKETVEIQVNTGCPWQWRRICFTAKGSVPGTVATTSQYPFSETNDGMVRVVNNTPGNRNAGPQYSLYEILFKGQNASDWSDVMTAPADHSRVSIKYDKVRTISSGNEDGIIRTYKHWHPMGKSLVYNDDEVGSSTKPSYTSTLSRAGMGDYYVVDIFRARYGSTATDNLLFQPQATLYWHER